jgi:hypothetical protein
MKYQQKLLHEKLKKALHAHKDGMKHLIPIYLDDYRSLLDYNISNQNEEVDNKIIELAILFRMGRSFSSVGKILWPELNENRAKQRSYRLIKKNLQKYPKLFKAEAK